MASNRCLCKRVRPKQPQSSTSQLHASATQDIRPFEGDVLIGTSTLEWLFCLSLFSHFLKPCKFLASTPPYGDKFHRQTAYCTRKHFLMRALNLLICQAAAPTAPVPYPDQTVHFFLPAGFQRLVRQLSSCYIPGLMILIFISGISGWAWQICSEKTICQHIFLKHRICLSALP